jgi:hypothetical protein
MRLTAAESVLLNRRITELCAQRTSGPDLTAILNQEMGVNWSIRSYAARVRRHGQVWTMKRQHRTCQFQGDGCRRTFEPKANDKYCDVCKKAAERENRHAYTAKNLSSISEIRRKYEERRRKLVASGEILAALRSKPLFWRLIVPHLLLDPDLSNRKVQELAGIKPTEALSRAAMNRLRRFCGVRGKQGGIRRKL